MRRSDAVLLTTSETAARLLVPVYRPAMHRAEVMRMLNIFPPKMARISEMEWLVTSMTIRTEGL
jgi:hypothetical protein